MTRSSPRTADFRVICLMVPLLDWAAAVDRSSNRTAMPDSKRSMDHLQKRNGLAGGNAVGEALILLGVLRDVNGYGHREVPVPRPTGSLPCSRYWNSRCRTAHALVSACCKWRGPGLPVTSDAARACIWNGARRIDPDLTRDTRERGILRQQQRRDALVDDLPVAVFVWVVRQQCFDVFRE